MEFRTENQPFKVAMQGFVQKIVSMMKSEKLFEPQEGPIIMSQIENEYGPVEWEIGAPGKAYSAWAAKMVVGLNTGVPWIMCKQETAPDPIASVLTGPINRKCGLKPGLAGNNLNFTIWWPGSSPTN